MSLLVLSTAGNHEVAQRMIESAKRHGLNVRLEVCGLGHPHGADIQSTWAIGWLSTIKEDYVLMADAPDVLFLAGEDEIMEKFRSFNKGMVMSAEGYCMIPYPEIIEAIGAIGGPGRHPWPNCGCWIAERKYAIEILQKADDLYRFNPPHPENAPCGPGAWFTYGLVDKTLDFGLDRESVLFQSMGSPQTNTFPIVKDGRIYNTLTGTWPIAIHYNGGNGMGREPYYNMAKELYGI